MWEPFSSNRNTHKKCSHFLDWKHFSVRWIIYRIKKRRKIFLLHLLSLYIFLKFSRLSFFIYESWIENSNNVVAVTHHQWTWFAAVWLITITRTLEMDVRNGHITWQRTGSDMNFRVHHHHYHGMLLARISLTLSRHSSLSSISLGRSSMLCPVSVQSFCRCDTTCGWVLN